MKHRVRIFYLLTWSILLIGTATAQSNDAPYIVAHSADDGSVQLFAIYDDGQEQQLTNQPDVLSDKRGAAISPDGRYLVYQVVADFFAEAVANNEAGNFADYITDLYLLDLQTLETYLIAGQEDGVTLRSTTVRTHPIQTGHAAIWSSDSTLLAYAIHRPNCSDSTIFCSRIMVYDVETHSSQVIADFPTYATPRLWTSSGIVVHDMAGSFRIYDLNGNEINRVYYNSGFVPHYVVQHGYDIYAAGGVLGFQNPNDDFWYLFDVRTGVYYRTDAYISVISASAPDDSLVLANYSNDTRPASIYTLEGEFIRGVPSGPPYGVDYVLSPDGLQYSYNLVGEGGGDGVMGNLDGETTIVRDGSLMAWGARQYILFYPFDVVIHATEDPYTTNACGVLPVVGLIPGGQGRVLDGTANRLRLAPDTDADTISNIPAGEIFQVVDGQQNVCVDGIRWAQVTYNGITGWTAEGFEDETFIEPVSG